MPRYRDLTHTARPSDAPRYFEPKNPIRTTDPGALQLLIGTGKQNRDGF